MLTILDSLFDAVAEGAKLLQLKEASKWRDQYIKLRLELQVEKARGYDSDDAKIEALYQRIAIIAVAARDEFRASTT